MIGGGVSGGDGAGPSIMLAAGEASGDVHGATLCRALADLAPGWRLYGMGGARMAAAGVQVIVDVTSHAVVGGSEAIGRIPVVYRAYRRMLDVLTSGPRPRALVLIDFPEVNFRLARAAHGVGVPVVYFIPPQIWAWRGSRLRTIRRLITRVLAVFPFEVELYRGAGVDVEFVGHPLVDGLAEAPSPSEARRKLGLDPGSLVLGLLPGSRVREIERLLPSMRDAAGRVARAHPEMRCILGLAPTLDRAVVEHGLGGGLRVDVVEGGAHAVMAASDLALVASGTASLETALIGTPMIICYRVSNVSARLLLLSIRIPWIGLPNIVLGRTAVPELFQEKATGFRIGREALRLLDDPGALAAQRAAFGDLRGAFGPPGVGLRAARSVLDVAGVVV